ncbi:MAG: sialate O-acetylesterase, partial [Verrucomicrobiota bacterium]
MITKLSFRMGLGMFYLLLHGFIEATVQVPAIFSDHAVLLSSENTPIWGKAAPSEAISVHLANKTASCIANEQGQWKTTLNLKDLSAGPFELIIEGQNKIILSDIVVGQVWVCSGQSNMMWPLINTTEAQKEIAESENPFLRQFEVEKRPASSPQEDLKGVWTLSTPTTSKDYSAVAYYFGKNLQKELQTPIGLIHSSWGGTDAEAWTSAEGLGQDPVLSMKMKKVQPEYTVFQNFVKNYAK